jgi:Amidohydrolase family
MHRAHRLLRNGTGNGRRIWLGCNAISSPPTISSSRCIYSRAASSRSADNQPRLWPARPQLAAYPRRRWVVHIAAVRGEPNPPARLTVRDLLEFATVRGAQNAALLHKIGTPTPGKQADVVVIRAEDVNTMPLTNAISTVVSHAHAGNIEAVFIAGDIRIEIVTDGEYSKPGFFTYIRERFDGFEARPSQKLMIFRKEVAAFPEYYAQYFKEAMIGGAILPIVPVVCTGPVKYKGEAKLQIDIANVKAAAKARRCPGSSRVSAGYGTVGRGRQRVLHDRRGLLSRARRRAEQGIPHDRRRGTLSQVDDPFLPDIFVEPRLDDKQMRRRAGIYVEATNVALSGIPAERAGALPHLLRHQRGPAPL